MLHLYDRKRKEKEMEDEESESEDETLLHFAAHHE